MAVPRPDRRIFSVCLLAVLLGSALPCSAQRETEFLGVKSWQGSLRLKANYIGSKSVVGGGDAWDFQWSADLQFKLEQFIPGGQYWRGKFVGGSAAVRHKNVQTSSGCTITSTLIGEGLPKNPEFFLYVGPGNNYSMSVADNLIPGRVTNTVVCDDQTTVLTNDGPASWFTTDLDLHNLFPLPATGFDLIGGGKYPMGLPLPVFTLLFGAPTFLADVSWEFHGVASPLEVVIEPQDYDNWRPEAAADEATPGNDITVKATLQHEDGSPLSALEKAQKFEFQLANVSKEPGIAMNYPLADKAKNTPDLQFDETRNGKLPIIVTGVEYNQADSFGLPHETATAIVSAYDWGAWGEIKVTAVTGDGSRIAGYLKGDKLQTSVRLPKRAKDSFIADGWKTSKGLSSDVQDNDDKEKEPQGLAGCEGDGLTVYEEYRGFIENGKHIEGNLDKKDFFILNLIGADAEPGIWLFTEVSQLEVHKDLKEDEMSQDDRLINGNCDKCPHRVAQHGVYMEEVEGMSGGSTQVLDGKVRSRPGLTLRIKITPRMALEAGYYDSMSSLDTPLLYDKIVAHELGHSVGLEHHGEGDDIEIFSLQLPFDGLGRPQIHDNWGIPVILLDEKTEIDVIDRLYSAYVSAMAYIQGRMDSGNPLDPQSEMEIKQGTRFPEYYVGRPSQQHSGAVECIMRYNYASAYPKEATLNPQPVFYLVPPGTEPLGSQLCDTTNGTGINAPRKPQPRYFGAADNRGNCRNYVCVNDAIPPGTL